MCILPRVLERASKERSGPDGTVLTRVAVRVAFDFISARDASLHSIETYGEALDAGDRASAKAMTGAYKQAVLQAFCIPAEGTEGATGAIPRGIEGTDIVADPDQGWEQWSLDIQEMIGICETTEALGHVQSTYPAQLRASSKRHPEVFAAIGEAMQCRRNALAPPPRRRQASAPVNAGAEIGAKAAADA